MMAASGRPQMHFGQHPYGNPANFQYPHMQQNYMGLLSQQPGMTPNPTSQAYPANLAVQRPGLYPQVSNAQGAGQAGGILPGGGTPGTWQSPQLQQAGGNTLATLPVSQQGGTPAGGPASQGQQGSGNPMQGMFLRPGHSPLPQGGMLHQFPMNAQAPHLAGGQQAGIPGIRPAGFLQVVSALH